MLLAWNSGLKNRSFRSVLGTLLFFIKKTTGRHAGMAGGFDFKVLMIEGMPE